MSALGVFYLKGLGVEQDLARAQELLEAAAVGGHAEAAVKLEVLGLRGL